MRVDPYYVSNLARSLDLTQSAEQQLTTELSSGVRVNSLSDDPVAAGENVVLLNQIEKDDSFTASASTASGQLQVADSALGSVASQLTSAISLATSANNGTLNSNDVKSVATQISSIVDEVQSLANTSYQGQYIFAGSRTTTAPFVNSNSSPAIMTYNGDSDINYLETPSGQKIQLNVPGNAIFSGSGTNNVFTALNNLVADYSGGTVNVAKAVTDTQSLNTALGYVSQKRVTIDDSITQLSAASDGVSNERLQLTSTQTNLMQADVASISTQLSTAESQQTALEDVIAQLGSSSYSLFSKL